MLAFLLHDRRQFALQAPHHVRHADLVEHGIVPAGGARVVAVEAAQVGVEPVGAARPRDHAEVGRGGAEPDLGIGLGHAHFHGLTGLFGGEQQVVLDLVFAQAQVLQARVAHG
jgi:hypothetical protein